MSTSKYVLKSDILLETRHNSEQLNFTWRISDYSKIYDTVHVDFASANDATFWRLKLVDKKQIELWRLYQGDPVKVDIHSEVKATQKTFSDRTVNIFNELCNHVEIAKFELYTNPVQIPTLGKSASRLGQYLQKLPIALRFENDMFELHCKMNILGPAMSKSVRSPGTAENNMKQLCIDFGKLLTSKEHCDISISAEDKTIPVHKAILCARSPVFDRMFQSDMLENKSKVIKIDDMDFDTIGAFVFFLYSGELKELCWDKAMKLYYVADKYEVDDLRRTCSQYLEFNLTKDISFRVLKLADVHKDNNLKKAVIFFMRMHAADVTSTIDWIDLVKNDQKLAAEVFE